MLKRRPVAIARDGPRGGLVAACSRAAVARGIHPNMPLAEAQALAPNLIIAPYDPPADRCALEKLAEACEQFTPFVALEDPGMPVGEPASAGGATAHPESLLLDITNLEHLHGSEHQLATRVNTFFTRRGYHTRIAVAPTVGQAWALAHFGIAGCGLWIADYLNQSVIRNPKSKIDLPVQSLRILPDTAALLHHLGIQTIAQLQLLPRDDLAQRFGNELLRRLDQFSGAAPEFIKPHRAVAELEASHDLEEPTADRGVLIHVCNQLLHRLCRRLIARDQGAVLLLCTVQRARAFNCGLRIADCGLKFCHSERSEESSDLDKILRSAQPDKNTQSEILRIALVQPTASPRQLLELLDLHLETLSLREEVNRVQIRAAAIGRLGERQGELFTDRWPSDPHQLALLINRLSSRLGHDQVLRAEPRNSLVPERAVCYAPLTRSKKGEKGRRGKGEKKRSRSPSCLPLLLHPQPHPIKIISVAPDGPPQCIWLENCREQIIHHVGPERIETFWWRGPTIRRDYYRIATESGNHLWIFRQLTNMRWFLHGVFR